MYKRRPTECYFFINKFTLQIVRKSNTEKPNKIKMRAFVIFSLLGLIMAVTTVQALEAEAVATPGAEEQGVKSAESGESGVDAANYDDEEYEYYEDDEGAEGDLEGNEKEGEGSDEGGKEGEDQYEDEPQSEEKSEEDGVSDESDEEPVAHLDKKS